jgi:hypothetical protein
MSSKFDRSQYEPSLIEITLGALLSVLLGAVLSAAWLVMKPVATVRELPEEPVPGKVYYVEGRAGSTREWMSKLQQFTAGRSITLDEGDLNLAYRTKAAEAEKAAKDEEKPAPGMLTPGQLNFRIADGVLQIGAPVDVSIAGLIKTKVQVVAQGGFKRSGDTLVYAPDKFYVGSLRVEKLPVIVGMVMDRLLAAMNVSEDLAGAWDQLGDAKLEGAQLQLIML